MPVDLPAKPSLHSLGAAIERLRHNWGWIVALGAFLDLAGLVALGSVVFATIATVLLVGVMMLFAGGAELAMGFRARDWTHFFLWILGGILYVAAGVFAIVNPVMASVVLTLLLGAGLVAAGVVRLYLAVQLPSGRARSLVLLTAVVTGLLGIVIIAEWPGNSLLILGVLLAVDLILHGVGWMMFGFWLRNVHRRA